MIKLTKIAACIVCINFVIGLIELPAYAVEDNTDMNIESCFSYLKGQDFLKAIEFGKKAIKSSPKNFDSHFCLGISYHKTDESKLALIEFEKAELLTSKSDEIGAVYSYMGAINQSLGNYDEALKQHSSALAIYRDLNLAKGISNELNNIATVYLDTRQKEKALNFFEESLSVNPDDSSRSSTLSNIGDIYLSSDPIKAEEYYNKAMIIAEKNGDFHGQAVYMVRQGQASYFQGKYTRAKDQLQEGINKSRAVKSPVWEANSIHYLGLVIYKQGDVKSAIELLHQAINIFEKYGITKNVKSTQTDLDYITSQISKHQ